MKQKILIIGAGPAGLSAARVLVDHGFLVEVFESEEAVGGMSKSISQFSQIVDIGPHRFFSKDARLNQFWLTHTNGEYAEVSRLTRIFYNRKFFYYPLRGFDALFKLGFLESSLCVLSFIKAKLFKFKGDSFESWVANAFGYRLYRIFFKSYTEKLWGIKCSELDSDFAAQRIKGLNLYEAIKSAFFGGGGKKHKTLVDAFHYPKRGCGVVYENMKEEILKRGGKVHLGVKVLGICTQSKKAVGIITDRGEVKGDIVISSAPFSDMVCSMNEVDEGVRNMARRLKYRNTILVYVEIALNLSANNHSTVLKQDSLTASSSASINIKEQATSTKAHNHSHTPQIKLFEDNWIYVHSPKTLTGRITNFANWTKELQCGKDNAILCLEYWANDDEMLWNLSDDKLANIAKDDLLSSSLIPHPSLIQNTSVRKIHRSYPVYERGYKEQLHQIYSALDEFSDLYFIGRNGSFKYNNQDHSILMGLLCADKILGKECDLWHINTDYDYQEDAKTHKKG